MVQGARPLEQGSTTLHGNKGGPLSLGPLESLGDLRHRCTDQPLTTLGK
jgi:hypothetical protein